MSLVEAIRKTRLIPAQLEKSVPQMRSKGRFQVGADADIVDRRAEPQADPQRGGSHDSAARPGASPQSIPFLPCTTPARSADTGRSGRIPTAHDPCPFPL